MLFHDLSGDSLTPIPGHQEILPKHPAEQYSTDLIPNSSPDSWGSLSVSLVRAPHNLTQTIHGTANIRAAVLGECLKTTQKHPKTTDLQNHPKQFCWTIWTVLLVWRLSMSECLKTSAAFVRPQQRSTWRRWSPRTCAAQCAQQVGGWFSPDRAGHPLDSTGFVEAGWPVEHGWQVDPAPVK